MVEPLRFSPEELDRIEDALEGLEHSQQLQDPSPQVRGVLETYRDILQESRHAMPLQEVPQGVLASVLAEAHNGGAPQSAIETAPAEAKPPGFFARLRRSLLVPSLALAGTAALVLWIARPQDDAAPSLDAPLAQAEPTATPAPAKPAELEAADAEEAPAADPVEAAGPTPSAEEPADEQSQQRPSLDAPPEPAQTAAPGRATAPTSGALGGVLNDATKAQKEEKQKPEAAGSWAIVERADRARSEGDCAAARSDYMVATEDDNAAIRARAYAGLGLCNVMSGDDAGSLDAFERARGIDPSIDKFIKAEQRPSGAYRPSKKPRKKKRAPSKRSKTSSFPKAKSAPNAAPL